MIRFNYLVPDRLERAARVADAVRDPRVRAPLVAASLALIFLGTVRGVEDWRIAALEHELAVARSHDAATSIARTQVASLTAEVARLRRIDDYVRSVRRSGSERAEELASIGNTLPAHVWLTAIRDTGSGWSITGGARAVADVGSALLALERVPRVASTMLVSAQRGDREGLAVQYELRLGRR